MLILTCQDKSKSIHHPVFSCFTVLQHWFRVFQFCALCLFFHWIHLHRSVFTLTLNSSALSGKQLHMKNFKVRVNTFYRAQRCVIQAHFRTQHGLCGASLTLIVSSESFLVRMITRAFTLQLHLQTTDLQHEDTSGGQGAKALCTVRGLICETAATFS